MPFRYLDHTADLILEATGSDFGEACAEAGRGLTCLLVAQEVAGRDVRRRIELEGESEEELLVLFLNELIYRFAVHKEVFGDFSVRIGTGRLRAQLRGEKLTDKHKRGREVKACTRHLCQVTSGTPATVRVLLDV